MGSNHTTHKSTDASRGTAWALVHEHCTPLSRILRPTWSLRQCAARIDVATPWWVLVLPCSRNVPRFGAQLRLALDVLNALCACDGFRPSENPRFWRHALATLDGIATDELGPFDDAKDERVSVGFTHFTVYRQCDLMNEPCSGVVVSDLVTGGVDMEAIRDARARVQQTLRGFVTRPVGKITFQVRFEPWKVCVAQGFNIRRVEERLLAVANRFVDSAMELMALQQEQQQQEEQEEEANVGFSMARPAVGVEMLQLSLSFQMDALHHKYADGLARFLAIFIDGCVAAARVLQLEHLHVALKPEPEPGMALARVATLRVLGPLLRRACLLDGNSGGVRRLELDMWNAMADACIVGACLSIVPHASRLVALACHGVVMPEHKKHTHVRLAWLAYALSHPKRTDQLEHVEVLGLAQLPQHALDRVGDAVRSRVPLRDVISHALRATYQQQQQEQEVQYLVLGTTAMVESGALLYRKPSLSEDALTQVDMEDEELDAVAWLPASQWLGVVYPGFRLVWTRVGTSDGNQFTTTSTTTTTTISAMDNCTANSNSNSNVASLAELLSLRSLVCLIDPRREPSTTSVVLQRLFTGPALQRLRLDQTLVTKRDLSTILSCCTALSTLELAQCRVASLVPLVESYFSTSAADVSSLALLWLAEDAEDHQSTTHDQLLLEPLVAALERPDHPMTRTLGELQLSLDKSDHKSTTTV